MSPNAHIRSHRKPRRSSRNTLIRSGVAGGVLTTLAVTGAASPTSADKESPADTAELPSLDGLLAADSTKRAAHVTQTIAITYELDAAKTQAERTAAKSAAEAKQKAEAEAEAKEKAEAERKAAEERAAEERAAAERAARSSERSTLSGDSGSDSVSTSSADANAPASGNAAGIAQFVRAQVGKAYVSGATGPSAYDCSGLTVAAFKQAGISLPRTSQAQSTAGTEVGLGNLQPGDILYWGGKGSATHVAVYVGGGQYVGAQNPSDGVALHDMGWGGTPSGAVRML